MSAIEKKRADSIQTERSWNALQSEANNEHEQKMVTKRNKTESELYLPRARECVLQMKYYRNMNEFDIKFISLKWFDCARCVRFNCKSTQPSNSPTYVMRYCIYLNIIHIIPKSGSLLTGAQFHEDEDL